MTTDENLPPAGQLVLCWLLVYKEQRATEAEVKEGLPELNDPGSRETTHFGKALALLEQRQLCRREKNPEEIKDRIVLTESGHREALRHLGLTALPKRLKWGELRNKYLVTIGLQAQRNLATSPKPTLAEVRDAVCWKALGFESNASFTKTAVLEALLRRELGEGKRYKPGEALRRSWLQGEPVIPEVAPAPEEEPLDPVQGPLDLATFAKTVLDVARTAKTGRFGDNKVFISEVHRLFPQEMDLDTFKEWLLKAQRAGLVPLSRADLVEAMDPELVARSELPYLGATFHFVRLEEERAQW
jgi:hypothetical protein